MEITSLVVEFPERGAGKKTRGFLARPKEDRTYPAVIVIHEV
jgi:dienelactone hydrolase